MAKIKGWFKEIPRIDLTTEKVKGIREACRKKSSRKKANTKDWAKERIKHRETKDSIESEMINQYNLIS